MKKNQILIILLILLVVGISIYFFLGRKPFREGLEIDNIDKEKVLKAITPALVEINNMLPERWQTILNNMADDLEDVIVEPPSNSVTNTSMGATSNTDQPNDNHDDLKVINYDNYNHYNRTSSHITNGTVFYGPNGGTALILTGSNGIQTLKIQHPNSSETVIYTTKQPSTIDKITSVTYYGPNDGKAKIIKNNDNTLSIHVTTPSGVIVYTQNGIYAKNDTLTTYYGSTGNVLPQSSYSTAYSTTTATPITDPKANTVAYSSSSNNINVIKPNADYSSVLPPGIPASQIPSGKEDLYILKSQVIPPVCPAPNIINACPKSKKDDTSGSQINGNNGQTPWGASPYSGSSSSSYGGTGSPYSSAYPDYSKVNKQYLPVPVLADFSNFGM